MKESFTFARMCREMLQQQRSERRKIIDFDFEHRKKQKKNIYEQQMQSITFFIAFIQINLVIFNTSLWLKQLEAVQSIHLII